MLRSFAIFVFLVIVNKSFSQCVSEVDAFAPGEKVSYFAYYNWGFIWVHAGNVEFSVGQRTYLNKKTFQLEATGTSLKSYDWIFKVRDKFQSLVDMDGFRPMWAERNTSEGGFNTYENYVFTVSGKILSTTENTKKPLKRDTLFAPACTYDVLSLIYFSRTIDYNKYNVNDKIPLKCVLDNEVMPLFIRYKGKETIKARDGKKYRCIKFSVLVVAGTIFKGGEDMNVWVTDDENKIPVLVEAKVIVGSVKAYLNKIENARHEVKALIK